jgi:pantetheine-phosphate adenylyltransferase
VKKTAIYPGTFDPITNGHVDIIKRALKIFDNVIVVVAPSRKKEPLFTTEERMKLIKESTKGLKGAKTDSFDNLAVDYAESRKGIALIRGLRAVSDFEYELQMALMNRKLNSDIETVFMTPSSEHVFLSSSLVKEIAYFGGSVKGLVPKAVEKALKEKFKD